MRMYPRYTVREVMEEYAITFFTMLNEGYRLQTKNYIMLAQIASTPHMKDESRRDFFRQLEWAAKDPGDILGLDDNDDDGIDSVKNLFRKI